MRVENHHTQELSIPAGDVINLFTRQVVNLGLKSVYIMKQRPCHDS